MKRIHVAKLSLLAALSLGLAMVSTAPSYAWGGFGQRHPRRAEVLRRDGNLNRAINRDYGHLGGNYGNLERQDLSIRRQEQRDARMNGGFITRGQQAQLNGEENALRQEVRMDNTRRGSFDSRHPRRAEVLGRDANLNRSILQDRGHLDGQFGSLERQDRSIARQEQQDARANGGFITRAQDQQLNQEENSLRQQVNQDLGR